MSRQIEINKEEATSQDQVNRRKVLIITYYWPPSGGSGVQRWLKFVKYLPEFGWEPHVLTPENPAFDIRDPSLEKDVPSEAEVMRLPIWEPYEMFYKVSAMLGNKQHTSPAAMVSKKQSFFQKVSTWIRGNFLIPDPRVFWVRPAVSFLSDYIIRNQIPVIITTGPPHSLHLIGLKLKKKFPQIRWMADFRDPWTEWGLWDSLRVSSGVRRFHKYMERAVLSRADEIITITPFYATRFERLARRPVRLLTNGYDEVDFLDMQYERSGQFVIRHVGLVNEKCDPRPFMQALLMEMRSHQKFAQDVRVEFVGEVHPDFKTYISANAELARVTVITGSVPHDRLIRMYGSSSLLLLILTGYKDAEGFLPGKLFEYFATGLPVLGVGPPAGDAASLLAETGAGVMVASDDAEGVRTALREAYQRWLTNPAPGVDHDRVKHLSRREITGRLANILEQQIPANQHPASS